ncbi:hypothetical protein HYX10_00150 [Candidatus Woesearchaeota archaeon]|nr:hypothetical protein [Candidatus Woesearchaeota archaeon]
MKLLIVLIAVFAAGCSAAQFAQPPAGEGDIEHAINSFEECVNAGNPVMESYPRQCSADGAMFVEEIGQQLAPAASANKASQESVKTGLLSPRGCEGEGSFKLGSAPIALENLEKIRPMGGLSAYHVTPTDHQYWDTVESDGRSEDTTNLGRFEIYAPADGFIVDIEKGEDYRVVIEHSCTFYTIFIHIDRLSEKILAEVDFDPATAEREHAWPRIKVGEGDVIGTVGVGKFDFSVVDGDVTLQGFASPESYEGEPWKIHTVDTFDYYDEPLRSRLLAKNVRAAAPLGGKIDYDIDSRLIGNWFKEGSGKYRGSDPERYWSTHLSIVYDSIDPSQIRIGIGDFRSQSTVFGVMENSPDPADVGPSSGIIHYTLTEFGYFVGGEEWNESHYAENIESLNDGEIRGVALFQLIDDRRLKAEFFPDVSQASAFTGNAAVYER